MRDSHRGHTVMGYQHRVKGNREANSASYSEWFATVLDVRLATPEQGSQTSETGQSRHGTAAA